MASTKFTIAIIDEEQKERNKFLNFFEESFNVIEVKEFSDIEDLLEKIRSEKIDALAIDYKLRDHGSIKFKKNGDSIFKDLLELLKDFPAFILTNNPSGAKKESKKINPLFIVDKARMNLPDGREKNEFIDEIKSIINYYKGEINDKIDRFKNLEILRKKRKLTEKQENEYLALNYELSKSLKGSSQITWKYFSQETNKKLTDVISKTDDLIKELKKQK